MVRFLKELVFELTMRFEKRGLVLLLILVIFIVGCQSTKDGPETSGPYVGGTSGLQFAFQETEPPASVLDDGQQEFFITLLVRNMGEYTVTEGQAVASISGIDANAFGMSSLNVVNDVPITGAASDQGFIIEGAEELLEFPPAKYVNDVAADFKVLLRADLCYEYNTEALTNLCLKKNVVKKSIEDVCDTTNPALKVFNSGAPIQVNNVRQKAVGSGSVQISFTIQNVAGDLVYLPGSFTSSCKGQDDNIDMVKVTLTNPQGNFKPECSAFGKASSGNARLVGGKKEITCTIDTSGLQDVSYQDLLIIDVDYDYRQAITTNIVVENAV
jgi:hypothetical protein